ncbi:Kinesin-like protein NACK2 [Acorus calamus]|uniref:Kinesin-like protein NACK2 n=1 Tax=Acorus calamus TaxID=4465 RepID=A0AAV9D710_ACOCL|nr:Kinesin-like protein NACK2 [Acorus calamus]
MGAIGGEELMRWEKSQTPVVAANAAAAAGGGGGQERILVSVRLRPLNEKEKARDESSDWECINDTTIIFKNSLADRSMAPTAYSFDRVFGCETTTRQVYEEAAKEVALSVVSGINSSIFAYGQTSSGKTYTMIGITEYTVADIYDYIQKFVFIQHKERAFVLKFSAMEIYNEAVRDLLSADSTPLRLLDDPEIIESTAREFLGQDNSSTLAASVMEREIKELIQQRDLAQSRLEDLLRAKFRQAPTPCSPDACEDELSISASSGLLIKGLIFDSPISLTRMCITSTQDTSEDFEDHCREVQCIEMEESSVSRSEISDTLLTNENASLLPLNGAAMDFSFETSDQNLQIKEKTINNIVEPRQDESSPLPSVGDLSCSRREKLTRSRSCRASLMTGSSSLFEEADQNESTPPSEFENDFLGKTEYFVRKPLPLNYDGEIETVSAEGSQSSGCTDSVDLLNAKNINSASEEGITSLCSFVAGLKGAQIQLQKEFTDGQTMAKMGAEAHEDLGVTKNVKDVGLDPMENPIESPPHWPLEFEKRQKEIIELWQACNVSLVHRTYFFLLFKGDPTDSIYMEVELRRLSFLKRSLSLNGIDKPSREDGSDITPTSRVMLCKQMQRRYTSEERDHLYRKWGIDLASKQRRLQLAHRLWTETDDMDHVKESATIVAKLVRVLEPGKALKEMFGLSFAPQMGNRSSRRSYNWKHGMSTLI